MTRQNDIREMTSQIAESFKQLTGSHMGSMGTPELKAISESLNLQMNSLNENLKTLSRGERGDYSKELSDQIKELGRLRDLAPQARQLEQYASSPFSSILEEQFLSSRGKQQVTELTGRELDELSKGLERLSQAVQKGSKDVQLFAEDYNQTMSQVSRATGPTQQRSFLEQMRGTTGSLIASGTTLERGLEQGNITQTATGSYMLGKTALSMGASAGSAASTGAAALGASGGMAALAGTVATVLGAGAVVAAVGALAATVAGVNIAGKYLGESATPSFRASQVGQMAGTSFTEGAVPGMELPSDFSGNVDYARLRSLSIQSGGVASVEQLTQTMMGAAGRTGLGGGMGGALADLGADYAGSGVGIDTFNQAVDKFSRITNESTLVTALENLPEIVTKGGGTLTPEVLSGMMALTHSVRFGRGIDTENQESLGAMQGIRGSMALLGTMGIQGEVQQQQLLQGMGAGFNRAGGSSLGRAQMFALSGDLSYAFDPESILQDPEALNTFITRAQEKAQIFQGGDPKLSKAIQRSYFQQLTMGNEELTQLLMSTQGMSSDERMQKVREVANSTGESAKERNAKAQEEAGPGFDVEIKKMFLEFRNEMSSLNDTFKFTQDTINTVTAGLKNFSLGLSKTFLRTVGGLD